MLCCLSVFCFKAQVGINTKTPTRTLDVNGNLRVRSLENKSTDTTYDKVLVTNANGEIDYWTKQDVKDKIEALYVVNKKFTASKTGPDPTTIVPCGRFEFRYNSSTMPQIRLAVRSTSATRVYYNRIRKKDAETSSFDAANRSFFSNQYVTISNDTNNNNNWANIGSATSGPGFDNNTLDEYYITYPGDANLYRVSFVTRNSGSGTYNYTMVCEKF